MKKKIFSTLLIAVVLITTLNFSTPRQFAKENNEVANLALMLPESDIILAIDMNKTLNVVGPSLLSQDAKKIENLKKLMKSLENSIGINPYEINQIVAGIKLPAVDEKDLFGGIDYTVIMRTAHSNDVLLEEWSKKIDAIQIFNEEKEPTEKYMDAFKRFRSYKLTQEETEKITKLNKEFEEILKKISAVDALLATLPQSAKLSKSYKDSVKKDKAIVEAINRFQTLLKLDADVKSLRENAIKLQNRWYDVNLEDPKRGEKLGEILKESKAVYPPYKAKMENLVKVDALINFSNWEFYAKLAKKSFGLPEDDDYQKTPNEMMKEKLDEIVKTLNGLSTAKAKQNGQLTTVSLSLQRLENAMSIRLKEVDEVEKFDDIYTAETTSTKTPRSLVKSIKENAKISKVNGKRMITIDYDKISFWNPSFELEEEAKPIEAEKDKSKETKIGEPQIKTEEPQLPVAVAKTTVAKDTDNEHKKDEEKKKEIFAIGYLDDKTMVFGFEPGIRSILNRKDDYKNPKAAEMINTFKNPLVSIATNSKIFQNFGKLIAGSSEKKEEKKETPTDKFFKDINIFGSLEYDDDATATNDLIMSLGFSKNKVEDVFSIEADEEESSVFEVGDYQISKAIFYDLINTLKSFKASISFKFEKKKVAELIESSPQIIEDIRINKTKKRTGLDRTAKTKVRNMQNLGDLLTSPKFYVDLVELLANPKRKQ
ncbi:MAG: hypothetical protein K1X72_24940 [Pyrinomonadaceae bacterium]|nr:hypothetical protein [Pyrinomonadaceae bacterium]